MFLKFLLALALRKRVEKSTTLQDIELSKDSTTEEATRVQLQARELYAQELHTATSLLSTRTAALASLRAQSADLSRSKVQRQEQALVVNPYSALDLESLTKLRDEHVAKVSRDVWDLLYPKLPKFVLPSQAEASPGLETETSKPHLSSSSTALSPTETASLHLATLNSLATLYHSDTTPSPSSTNPSSSGNISPAWTLVLDAERQARDRLGEQIATRDENSLGESIFDFSPAPSEVALLGGKKVDEIEERVVELLASMKKVKVKEQVKEREKEKMGTARKSMVANLMSERLDGMADDSFIY